MNSENKNRMYERNLFRIHGDNKSHNHSASEGCIVLGPDARRIISKSLDRNLSVVK